MLLVACALAAPAPKADPKAEPKADPQYISAISPLHTVSAYTPYVTSSYVLPPTYISPFASFYSGLCKYIKLKYI